MAGARAARTPLSAPCSVLTTSAGASVDNTQHSADVRVGTPVNRRPSNVERKEVPNGGLPCPPSSPRVVGGGGARPLACASLYPPNQFPPLRRGLGRRLAPLSRRGAGALPVAEARLITPRAGVYPRAFARVPARARSVRGRGPARPFIRRPYVPPPFGRRSAPAARLPPHWGSVGAVPSASLRARGYTGAVGRRLGLPLKPLTLRHSRSLPPRRSFSAGTLHYTSTAIDTISL